MNESETKQSLRCEHREALRTRELCAHLLDDIELDHVQVFGRGGLDYAMVCEPSCAKLPMEALQFERVCPACFARVQEESFWDTGELGVRGRPQQREAAEQLPFARARLPVKLASAAIACAWRSGWLVYTRGRGLRSIDVTRGEGESWPDAPLDGFEWNQQARLLSSADGRYVALATRERGRVWELATKRLVLELARGDYHVEQTPFPLAFARVEQRDLLLHATDWNHLELLDLSTGRALHPRPGEAGEHHVDYFRGRLELSPGAVRVADSGWYWGPEGSVRSWALAPWLAGNVWEPDDGPSRRSLTHRAYAWNEGMCWLDDTHLAIWGYGNDDLNLIPAVSIYDAARGELLRWFPGPGRGELYHHEGRLLSAEPQGGLRAWDVHTGELLGHCDEGQVYAFDRTRGRALLRVGSTWFETWLDQES